MPNAPVTPIVTLRGTKACAAAAGITEKDLANLTGIPHARLQLLDSMNVHKAEEPWLREARLIANALNVTNLAALLAVGSLDDVDVGFGVQDTIDTWRTGCPLPLTFAIRIAREIGVADPLLLDIARPLDREVWQIIAAGERSGAPGICPWCHAEIVGDAGHRRTCLPELLWGRRDAPMALIGVAPKPRRPGVRRNGSRKAPGLRRLREARGTTQAVMAASLELNPTYYSRLESMRDPLTETLAERICALYKIPIVELYS